MSKLEGIGFVVVRLVLAVACMALLSSCGTKNLSKDSFNSIRNVSINTAHITTEQKDVVAAGFWWGLKRYNDFVPLLENGKLFAKIFRQALVFQIDSNDPWEVTGDEHSDVDFFFDYTVLLSQTADTKKYQMIVTANGRLVDKGGNIVWRKTFLSDMNPYSNEKVAYPLQDYYQNSIALQHAVGAASVQLSAEIIEDLGGAFSWPLTPIWEGIE